MGSLYDKSALTLELPQVLVRLAEHAVSPDAKDRLHALRPLGHVEDIRHAMQECTDAQMMMRTRAAPGFSGLRDVTGDVKRAEMGGVLGLRELLHIASLLRCARAVREWGEQTQRGQETEKNTLSHLFAAVSANKYLEESISDAILSEDEVADSASNELFSIRKQIRAANARVREVLQRIIGSTTYAKYLQDSIITMRGDRYVVPVKSEHKGDVAGLVHDVSSSGQTLFIEPVQVVEANNEIRLLSARERKEIERILASLSAEVAGFAGGIVRDYEVLTQLDIIFARAKYALAQDAVMPRVREDGVIDLCRARHPLLGRESAVPIDIRIGRDFDTLVITGPNTGGKTVALKTLGLLTMMAQCGLHIPASDASEISTVSAIYADIGDEQSISQSLSTFSSHMTNIVGILRELDSRALVLFDELGAGTDPVEGAALAVAIIEHVRAVGARVAATTHYAELKAYALSRPGVENAACEFNVETLRPTYRLLIGVPGKSNAFAISARLGLPENVIESARTMLTSETVRFEDVLTDLESQRSRMENAREGAERERAAAEAARSRAEEMRKKQEAERERMLERARGEARALIETARAEMDQVYSELEELRRRTIADAARADLQSARAQMSRKLRVLDELVDEGRTARPKPRREDVPSRPLKLGDIVEISGMGTRATVLSLPDKNGNLTLQAGIMKLTLKRSEVTLLEGEGEREAVQFTPRESVTAGGGVSRTMQAGTEIDLRGQNADEAIIELERFLDTAALASLPSVTVIHGKGTGVLRAAVQDALRRDRRIKSFRLGRYGEGETGVTIVEFR